jgi:predicted ferric reductase
VLFPCVRRFCYEIFLKSHYTLAVFAGLVILQHVNPSTGLNRIYPITALSLLGITTMLRTLWILYRNIRFGKLGANTVLQHLSDASHLSITLARPLDFRAGQYIQLWTPGTSFWSFAQTHPFMITWWNEDRTEIDLLLEEHSRRGFIHKLVHRKENKFLSWVDGPYGLPPRLGNFGTVILIAEGIGIAAQLPHIREVLMGCQDRTILTRKMVLIWQYYDPSKYILNSARDHKL